MAKHLAKAHEQSASQHQRRTCSSQMQSVPKGVSFFLQVDGFFFNKALH